MTHYSEQIENDTGYEVTSLSTHNSLVAENAKLRLLVEKLNKNPEYKLKALKDQLKALKDQLKALKDQLKTLKDQLKAKDAEIKELKSYHSSCIKLAYRYKDKLDKHGLGDK